MFSGHEQRVLVLLEFKLVFVIVGEDVDHLPFRDSQDIYVGEALEVDGHWVIQEAGSVAYDRSRLQVLKNEFIAFKLSVDFHTSAIDDQKVIRDRALLEQ